MPFSQSQGIRYFTFDLFPPAVTHAVFTRQGGVSPAPWDSLNVGGSAGDELTRVRENRFRSFDALGRKAGSVFDVWQVHSAEAVCAEKPRDQNAALMQADIVFTDNPDVTLYMRFADCVPILLFDPTRGIVGMAHAGWQGTVRGAATAAIKKMREHYGSEPSNVLAAIGPSIGVDHYEVGPDVVTKIQQAFGREVGQLIERRDGITYLDLWTANALQLQAAGVERIEVAEICTACHLDDWFSHRAEKGKTGRFGALIALQS